MLLLSGGWDLGRLMQGDRQGEQQPHGISHVRHGGERPELGLYLNHMPLPCWTVVAVLVEVQALVALKIIPCLGPETRALNDTLCADRTRDKVDIAPRPLRKVHAPMYISMCEGHTS